MRRQRKRRHTIIIVSLLLFAFSTVFADGYVGSRTCESCHSQQYKQWLGSHHQLAMQRADAKTVLADFNNTSFTYFDTTSRFFMKNGKFYVNTDGPYGKLTDYEIKYVFGVEPLQQYLIEFPNGHIQSLSIAWDTVKNRWFHLYPDDQIKSDDPLHWTKLYQNWNMMCGECHTTNYRKNYDSDKKSYNTQWSEINVSCEACHGPGSTHVEWVTSKTTSKEATKKYSGFGFSFSAATAEQEVEACAPCHSRRTNLTETFLPGQPFMDNFMLSHLGSNLYYPDGQIQDEVYVYGSFLQSSMHQAGVRCSDCHNPHTNKVKYKDNKLCVQCHNPKGNSRFKTLSKKEYDTKSHHFHDAGSTGSRCVACHAPERIYMMVDPRRDHSFRVPRPDLSEKFDTPNACNTCHTAKDAKWAIAAINKWYGKKRKNDRHFTETFYNARRGDLTAEKQLNDIANDQKNPAIIRATAIRLIRGVDPKNRNAIIKGLKSQDALVRAYAADRLVDLPIEQRIDHAFDLLEDPIRIVRMQAARAVADLPVTELGAEQNAYISKGLDEYFSMQQTNADLPGGQLNLGVVYAKQNKFDAAEKSYLEAIRLDPTFIPARFNLANLYNKLGENESAIKVLREGIKISPQHGELYYSLGLLLAEERQLEQAARELKRAVALITDKPRMFYNYGLILQKTGKQAEAGAALINASELAPGDPKIVYALVIFYVQQQEWKQALPYAQRLVKIMPGRPEPKKLLSDIKAQMN